MVQCGPTQSRVIKSLTSEITAPSRSSSTTAIRQPMITNYKKNYFFFFLNQLFFLTLNDVELHYHVHLQLKPAVSFF